MLRFPALWINDNFLVLLGFPGGAEPSTLFERVDAED
jgi:hypothetical protein